MNPGNNLEIARLHREAGHFLVPLCRPNFYNAGCFTRWHRQPCTKAGKRPLMKGFNQIPVNQERAEHAMMLFETEFTNIGHLFGPHLIAADTDSPIADAELVERAAVELRTPTRSARPGRGRVFYFWCRWVAIVPAKSGLGTSKAIDILGTGSYLVLPPSVAKDGHQYAWEPGLSPSEVPVMDLPAGLRDLVFERKPLVAPNSLSLPNALHMSTRVSSLITARTRLANLFDGTAKTRGDESASGYDFSFALELLRLRVSPGEVVSALYLRPGVHRRDSAYAQATVTKALAHLRGAR